MITMKCPRCIEKMEATNSRGISTFTCFYCSGNWIAEDSLLKLLEIENTEPKISDAFKAIQTLEKKDSKRSCLFCENVKLKAIYIKKVEIDYCVSCRGLFFDKGELNQLLPNAQGTDKDFSKGKYVAAELSIWTIILGLGSL